MNVLVINCGSSSLKYQLINAASEAVLASGICERIGIEGGKLVHKLPSGEKITIEEHMDDHMTATKLVLDTLTNENHGVIKSLSEIGAVGHRLVHGGEKFSGSTLITDEVIKAVEECNDLAPLHNPANLIGIEACKKLMPNVPMVGVFDTAFHQTMPRKAFLYGIPYEYYQKYKVRRYGFHGTSHSYVSKRVVDVCGLDKNNSKVIVCHLGNGASISAVKNGESIDTSMGLTPLEGLLMGTRCGDIDPAIIEFIAHKENLSIDEIMDILNKKSGMLGVSNLSSDSRDLEDAAAEGNEDAKRTIEVYNYRIAKYIGSYITALNGVDAIAFTAGVGENNPDLRTEVCSYLEFLGVKIDQEKNKIRGKEVIISTDDSKVKICVIPTNEELAIARETVAIVNK
ncbi:acetate kinase [Mobilisporobacter senegalensis]|uniref:Acetate kinase n=1 Tax=Mobilisporobacter senegalensis TaxID=1329262 RepID=A0A3N1XS02_9FIRM|nr:acetate kinase [Mobilisporobacter senegalensis]ROR29443.1 acetate kinase [Mobilisporobacter senegalensis]